MTDPPRCAGTRCRSYRDSQQLHRGIHRCRYPNLRVAFIDEQKVPRADGNGQETKFFSVLIRYAKEDPGVPRTRETVGRTLFAVQGGRIEEVYRVQLPCNPIIGEGKPENQNHAIIFTRGEALQATNPRARAKTHALTHTAAYTTEFR